MGRPTKYTVALAGEICGRLASGESLNGICRDEKMPGLTTVYRWIAADDAFRELYARAREDQADTLADEILDIADEDPTTTVIEKTGQVAFDSAAIAHQKLRIDTRKWIAAKLKPKKYSDKVDHTLAGPDGGPLVTKVVREIVRPKNPDR